MDAVSDGARDASTRDAAPDSARDSAPPSDAPAPAELLELADGVGVAEVVAKTGCAVDTSGVPATA